MSYFSGMELSSPFLYLSLIMDKRIRKYCEHIRKRQIEILRKDKDIQVWYWDLPAMAAICHDKRDTHFAKGYAHNPKGTKWHSFLKRKLLALGNIGKGSHIGQRYIIGNCAEQHAGNNYMNKYHENDVSKLHFTEAVRPRTMQVFPYCDNCKAIFPNL